MQIILIAAGVVLITLFYVQLLHKPVANQVRGLRLEQGELERELQDLETGPDTIKNVTARYDERLEEAEALEEEVAESEANLLSLGDMSTLLDQLTASLEAGRKEFVSVEPRIKKAEEGKLFDTIQIEMKFYRDFSQVIAYLKKLEESSTALAVDSIEFEADTDKTSKPLVTLELSAFVTDHTQKEDLEKEIEQEAADKAAPLPESARPVPEPFRPEAKPYDNRLPGEHKLSMVVWRGGIAAALIDGKVMKVGSIFENWTVSKIDSDRVWFSEDGKIYYLAIES